MDPLAVPYVPTGLVAAPCALGPAGAGTAACGAHSCVRPAPYRRISPSPAFFGEPEGLNLVATPRATFRGSFPCASFFSFRFFSHRWPAACRTPIPVVPVAPLQGLSSLTRPTATWLPVPRLARLRALRPAASTWACRPAARATDLSPAAQGRQASFLAAGHRRADLSETIRGAFPPGGLFVFPRGATRAAEEATCSRRS